uniref:Uncharacterized protein n=1 Tax=Anguilla anguilla TaxID=7936 RepID=A0A0E9RCP1_ANGAN
MSTVYSIPILFPTELMWGFVYCIVGEQRKQTFPILCSLLNKKEKKERKISYSTDTPLKQGQRRLFGSCFLLHPTNTVKKCTF